MTFGRNRHPPESSLDRFRRHPSVSFAPGALGRRETVSAVDRVLAAAIESFIAPAALIELLNAIEPAGEDVSALRKARAVSAVSRPPSPRLRWTSKP
jgi:hypothetical protein